jgi:hypothetical protein
MLHNRPRGEALASGRRQRTALRSFQVGFTQGQGPREDLCEANLAGASMFRFRELFVVTPPSRVGAFAAAASFAVAAAAILCQKGGGATVAVNARS